MGRPAPPHEAPYDAAVPRIVLIVNPYSRNVTRKRVAQVTAALARRSELVVRQTERRGHASELAAEHSVRFEFGNRVGTPATRLDPAIREAAAEAAHSLGIATRPMPTVGHDAAVLARFGVPAAVLLVRNSHGSHNPAEDMALSDFIMGVKVLAGTALRL